MFDSFDLDLMTLVLKLDLDVVKIYLHTQNEVPSYGSSKVIAWTDRQTHSSEIITYPHMRMVNISDECNLHTWIKFTLNIKKRQTCLSNFFRDIPNQIL